MNETSKQIKHGVLFVVCSTAFLTGFAGVSANIAIPTIGREFAADTLALNWIATAFLLATSMFLVPFGRVGDIYGKVRLLQYGLILFSIASVLCALADSTTLLIGYRALQGIATAMLLGTGAALTAAVYPPPERGRALGILTASAYLGISLGPFLGGILTEHFGWRFLFEINVPLSLVTLFVLLRALKTDFADARGERLDVIGSAIFSLALVIVMLGFTILPDLSGGAVLLCGLAGLGVFAYWESRVPNPVLHVGLFRHNKLFALSNVSSLINYAATYAVGYLLSLYLQFAKGLSPQEAGFLLVAQPVALMVVSPLSGLLSDRIEPRKVASSGMALSVLALFLLSFLDGETALWFVVLCLVLFGVGVSLFISPNTNAVMGSVRRREYGIAAASIATMRLTGQMLSMALAMIVFTVVVGRVQITAENIPQLLMALRAAMFTYASLCFIGVFTSMARGRPVIEGQPAAEVEAEAG